MYLNEEIDKAIGTHGLWKYRLKDAIEKGSFELSPEEVAKDNHCSFGKWLYSNSEIKSHRNYKELITIHSKFHAEAGNVLTLAITSRKHEAIMAMADDSTFAKTSMDLIKLLVSIKMK